MNFKKLFGLFIVLLYCQITLATHIVGGMVTYTYLGNRKYLATFKVYRDCKGATAAFDGDPSAVGPPPNAPFYYAVFDNLTGQIVDSNYLTLIKKENVRSVLVSDCLDTTLACVEEALYVDTFEVPSNTRWYSIVHQRCCRNNSINNLKPLPAGMGGSYFPGMTIFNIIPPTETYMNNSAVFKQFPPLFLCVGKSFNFDHSATDVDGDVLKYYLFNPLDGGTSNAPQPRPHLISNTRINAAFEPPYSLTNIMGGTSNLSIDENTGQLFCKPDAAGRYVVSVMVKEYRGGICIDSAIRDFQFNVFVCDIPNSELISVPGSYDPVTKMFDYKVNCKNKTIDFVNSSTNSQNYYWNFGEPSSGTRDTSTAQDPSHEYADTGVYTVTLVTKKTIFDGRVCKDTLKALVRIYPTFNADFQFNATVPPRCPGDFVSFADKSVATFGRAVKWRWDFGDGEFDTTQNPIHQFDFSGNFNVKLTATSNYRCVADTQFSLRIASLPTISATLPNACIGQPFKPVCNVTVPAPDAISSVRWTLPDRTDNNCATSYTPPNFNQFTVRLWAQTDKGCKDSQSFNNIRVNPLPTITAMDDTFICYDSKIRLDANGGVSYFWTPAAQMDNPNSKNPIASPVYPNATQYVVKGTDALGCYNFDSVLVSFHAKAFIDAGKDTNTCLNPGPYFRERVMLTGKGTFITSYWTPPIGLDNANSKTPIAQPPATTDYVFNGIDQFNCIVKDTVKVIVFDPSLSLFKKSDTLKCSYDTIQLEPLDLGDITEYKWSPPSWMKPGDASKRRPSVYNRDTTVYTLKIRNYCYDATDSIKVNTIPSPETFLPRKDSTCYGTIYKFNLNAANSYRWAPVDPSLDKLFGHDPKCNPKASLFYYITATNSFGCTVSEAMEMIVNYPPNFIILDKPRFICKGDSVKMTVLSDNSRHRIRWSPGKYISDSFSREIYYFPPATEDIQLKVLSAENCFTIEKLRIPVQLPIKPNVQTPVRFCQGRFAELYASGGMYYLWKPPYKLNDSTTDKPQVSPESSYRYTVKVSNDCFFDTIGVLVIMDTLPKIYTTNDTSIYRGEEIEITAKTTAPKIEWYPQELIPTNPFLPNIKVQPSNTSTYYVRATDGNNCVGLDSVNLKVYSKNVLLIPTAFSPNGDGINDVFKVVKHLNVKTLNFFQIFNRWGEKVFSTTNIDQGWDGTFNGDPVPTGSYSWQIQITNYDKEKITKSGTIEIIR